MHRIRQTSMTLALWALVFTSHAASPEQAIRARLAAMFPDVEVTSIAETPVRDLYEVMLGASLLYVSGDGRYVLKGDLIDLEQRTNISDQRRAEARRAAFSMLDPSDPIEFGPSSGRAKEVLYVYTDIDCGYCRKLHREVPELNRAGIAVRYLAFPRAGLHSESYDKAVAVWCSANRQEALTAAKAGKPVSAPKCDNPVAAQFDLGREMGVSGTPAVYTADGRALGGYIPAKDLIDMMRSGRL